MLVANLKAGEKKITYASIAQGLGVSKQAVSKGYMREHIDSLGVIGAGTPENTPEQQVYALTKRIERLEKLLADEREKHKADNRANSAEITKLKEELAAQREFHERFMGRVYERAVLSRN